MRQKTNECAVCAKPIYGGLLMCSTHWHQVPAAVQDRVYRTWGRFQRSKAGAEERLQLLADYRKARDEAVAAIAKTTS